MNHIYLINLLDENTIEKGIPIRWRDGESCKEEKKEGKGDRMRTALTGGINNVIISSLFSV